MKTTLLIITALMLTSCGLLKPNNPSSEYITIKEVHRYYIVTQANDTLYLINFKDHAFTTNSTYDIRKHERYTPSGIYLQTDLLSYREIQIANN